MPYTCKTLKSLRQIISFFPFSLFLGLQIHVLNLVTVSCLSFTLFSVFSIHFVLKFEYFLLTLGPVCHIKNNYVHVLYCSKWRILCTQKIKVCETYSVHSVYLTNVSCGNELLYNVRANQNPGRADHFSRLHS